MTMCNATWTVLKDCKNCAEGRDSFAGRRWKVEKKVKGLVTDAPVRPALAALQGRWWGFPWWGTRISHVNRRDSP